MVFNKRTGVFRLLNFQQRITSNPGQFRLLLSVQRFSVLVRREFIVGQFVGENSQTDLWIALQFPRDVKRVLVQLARAGRKSRN